jgi:hypothetical protein
VISGEVRRRHRQRGVALVVLLAIVAFVLIGALLTTIHESGAEIEHQRLTTLALGMARDALIARAATDRTRPGSLPCPDTNNDGSAELFAGVNCPGAYVGRLPWRTLGLPDLRDGYGERLWYALSPNFRDLPTAFTGTALNSDTPGLLTVTGTQAANNVIAIIFSPGPPLDGQFRDAANENLVSNYLEGDNATSGDQSFVTGATTGTFNDQALLITADMLWPAVEQRVAEQTLSCLYRFVQLQPSANGRFPWPATDLTYADNATAQLFGRIPTDLTNTNNSLGLAPGTLNWQVDVPQPGAGPSLCFDATTWWGDWRQYLFYSIADAFKPGTGAPGSCPSNCLYVNNKDSVSVAVIVAGRTIAANPTQARPSNNPSDYLETDPVTSTNNATGGADGIHFAKAIATYSAAINFNDRLVCMRSSPGAPCP